MTKLKVLALCLVLLLGISSGLVADITVAIGTGETYNTTTGSPTPYGTFFKNFRQQYLFTAAEIDAQGGGAGNINALAFNVQAVNNCSPMPNFTIRMKHTSQTALTTTFEAGTYQQVWYQNDFLPVAGWNLHTFSAPFNWNGTQSVIVDIVTTMIPTAYTQNASVYYTATTGVNTSLRYQSDTVDAGTYTGLGTVSVNRANIQFTMQPIVITGPPNPATLVSPQIGATTFTNPTLMWSTGGGYPSGYKVYLGTDGGGVNTPTSVLGAGGYDALMNTSYTHTTYLNPSQTYYWQIIPYNVPYGSALNCPIWSFTTNTPLTGTKIIGTVAPYDYLTFTAAINDLNTNGVGAGGVTFTVQPGNYAENPPAINVSGTEANQVIFQPTGETHPTLTPAGGTGTFGFKLNGADWITFDRIDITGTNTLIYGYWLAGIAGDGATNNTITGCVVEIPYGSTTNYGIYSLGALNGANSNNTIEFSTVKYSYHGIYLTGNSTAGSEALGTQVLDSWVTGVRSYSIYHGYGIGTQILRNLIYFPTGVTTALYGIYTFGANSTVEIADNTIETGSTSGTIYGFYVSSGANQNIHDNVIKNVTGTGTSTIYGAYLTGSGENYFMSNSIYGLTSNSTGTIYGVYTLSAARTDIGYNQIYSLTTSGSVSGVYVSSGTLQSVYSNKIHNLQTNTTGTTLYAAGVYVVGGTTNWVYNNAIYNLKAPTSTMATTAPAVRGIWIAGGTTDYVVYNSVYLDASAPAPSFSTAAFYMSSSTNSVEVRNNIFDNESTPGTSGKTVAFWKSVAGWGGLATTSNKNIYFTGEPGTTRPICFNGTAAYVSLEDYKAAVTGGIDAGSYTEDVPFESTALPYDLHIRGDVETRVEGNAIPYPVWIPADFESDPRDPDTPDIGCDEGEFLAPAGAPGLVTLLAPPDGAPGINPITGQLSWNAPGSGGAPTEYWIYVAEDIENIFNESFTVVATPITTLTLSDVEGLTVGFNKVYYWAVQAHNIDGESDADDPAFQIWSFTTCKQLAANPVLNLGNVWPNTMIEGDIPVQNLGTVELTYTVVGPPEFEFSGMRYTVPAGTTANLHYTFSSPAVTGSYTGTITLTQTSPLRPPITVEIAVSAEITTDVIVGTGTADLDLPVNVFYAYSYSQTIYYSSELSYPAGHRIEKVYYYFNGYETSPDTKDFVIYMGHTSDTAFATTTSWKPISANPDGLVQVYSGTNIPQLAVGGYWMEFVLNTPFIYNGTDNLVIGVEENAPLYDSSSSYFLCTNTTGINRSLRHYSDDVNADPLAPPAGTLIAGIPNTKFFVAPIPITPQITVTPESWNFGSVLINSTNTKQFSIQNTGTGVLTINNILPTTSGFFALTDLPVGFPATPINLPTGATMPFSIRYLPTSAGSHNAVFTISHSMGTTPVNVEGVCVDPRITSLPHTQNFDGVTAPALPLGWTGYKSNASMTIATSTTYNQTPANSVYLYNSSYTTDILRLVSPQITVPIASIKLSFWVRAGSTTYTLQVGTTNLADGSGNFNQIASITPSSSTSFVQYSVSFAGYSGPDQYICIQHGQGGTYRSFYLDSFLFEEILANDLAATLLNGPPAGVVNVPSTYYLSVYNNGTAVQNSYNIHLKRIGDDRFISVPINTPIDPGQTVIHNIVWTPQVSQLGTNNIVGEVERAGDGNATNNETTPAMAVTIYPAGTFIPQIGDITSATTANSIPFNLYYKNNVSETIFRSNEMQMSAGTINYIVFQNNFTQDLTKPVKIWLKHTPAANVSAGWLDFTGYQLVYNGDVHFPLGVNAVVIPITPFPYGGGNLAMRTYRVWEDVYWNTTNHFYYTASPEYPDRTRYHQIDGTGPLNPETCVDNSGVAFAGTLVNWIPNTAFIVNPATPITNLPEPVPQIVQNGNQVTVSWPEVPGAYAYRIYYSPDNVNWSPDPVAVVRSLSYVATMVGNMGYWRVVAVTTYREDDPGFVLNPASVIGFDNTLVKPEPLIPNTANKKD